MVMEGDVAGPVSEYRNARVPPHDLEAERSVLGSVLVRNDALHEVREVGVEPQFFYKQAHQKIFEVLVGLSDRGEPLDLITLTTGLRNRGWYDSIGGHDALLGLFDDAYAAGNVVYYAKIVREKALLRRLIEAVQTLNAEAYGPVEDVEKFLDEAEGRIFAVSTTRVKSGLTAIQDIILENVHAIEELASRKSEMVGLSTGFKDFDKLTSGLHPGQLVIVAGRPAMGKSCLALTMAQNAALNSDAVVAFFSLEMSKQELGNRLISSVAKIEGNKLKKGFLQDKEWTRLAQACDLLSRTRILIDDSGSLNVMDMRARCRRLLAREKKISLIVVDYLQLMQGSKSGGRGDYSREREISEISRNLKALAKELNVPIIALSQLNRGVESRNDKRPMLSDLRESGAIEQDADMVCFVYRDEVYNKETEDKGIGELIVAKHRAGETATIRLAWLSRFTTFGNLDESSVGSPVVQLRPDQGDVFI